MCILVPESTFLLVSCQLELILEACKESTILLVSRQLEPILEACKEYLVLLTSVNRRLSMLGADQKDRARGLWGHVAISSRKTPHK